MPSPKLHLPGLPLHPIPGDRVHLKVKVDTSRCVPPKAIADFDETWIDVSLIDLVTCGALYHTDRAWGLDDIPPRPVRDGQRAYLAYHRAHVYRGDREPAPSAKT
ncbi:MAG: hypothetical protein R3B06_15425 [Kofleriaceae bacterium]